MNWWYLNRICKIQTSPNINVYPFIDIHPDSNRFYQQHITCKYRCSFCYLSIVTDSYWRVISKLPCESVKDSSACRYGLDHTLSVLQWLTKTSKSSNDCDWKSETTSVSVEAPLPDMRPHNPARMKRINNYLKPKQYRHWTFILARPTTTLPASSGLRSQLTGTFCCWQ